MYRPTASAKFARDYLHQAVNAGTNALAFAGEALLGALIKVGIYEQAMRENRRRTRVSRRYNRSTAYANVGLNGPRAVARRLRQIAAGSLTAANGLVSEVAL